LAGTASFLGWFARSTGSLLTEINFLVKRLYYRAPFDGIHLSLPPADFLSSIFVPQEKGN
jgi:hypothetical protein